MFLIVFCFDNFRIRGVWIAEELINVNFCVKLQVIIEHVLDGEQLSVIAEYGSTSVIEALYSAILKVILIAAEADLMVTCLCELDQNFAPDVLALAVRAYEAEHCSSLVISR